MSNEQKPDDPSQNPRDQPSESRRRLLRASLGATPAILTLVSLPVRAGYADAHTASAFGSMATAVSRAQATIPTSGCKPSWWASCAMSEWPSSCKTAGGGSKLFKDIFSDYGIYGSKSIKDCLALGSDSGMEGVVKHCCAAYLNAASGKVPAALCSTTTAKDIWTSYTTRGHYEPTAGVKWFADSCTPTGIGGINPWLRTTMPN